MNIIRCKINVTRIEKARLFKGEKGTYLDCTLIELREKDQYGNSYLVTQDITKEERAGGMKNPVIGNGKLYIPKSGGAPPPPPSAPGQPPRPRKW